jgi:hypothetical protein
MGKELQEDEDWLGFDKLAKMLGELPADDLPKAESPTEPVTEEPAEPEIPGKDEGTASKD